MTLSSYLVALVSVITVGYIIAVGLGTIAYFANDQK